MLLQDVEAGEGTFLIVERTLTRPGTPTPGLHRDDGSCTLEHREGDAGHRYGTVAPDTRTARQLLTGWAFQLPGWKDRAIWSRVLLANR